MRCASAITRTTTTSTRIRRRGSSSSLVLPLLLFGTSSWLCVRKVNATDQVDGQPQEEQSRGRSTECELRCENDGTCALGANDELFESYEPLNLHFLEKSEEEVHEEMHCICPPGYIGYRCEVALAPCGDTYSPWNGKSHVCLNGAQCKEGISDAGESFYYCDCTTAAARSEDPLSFAGRMCEHASTVFCGQGHPKESRHTFCTNGGTCVDQDVDIDDEHPGCICPTGWEGRHCQYLSGTAPQSEYPAELVHQPQNRTESTTEWRGGLKRRHLSFLLMLTVVCVSSAFLILVVMREVHKDMVRSSTEDAVLTHDTPRSPSAAVRDGEDGLSGGDGNSRSERVPLTSLATRDRRRRMVRKSHQPPPTTVLEDDTSSDEGVGVGAAADLASAALGHNVKPFELL